MENDSAQFAVMASRMVIENDFTHLYKGSLPYLDKPHLHYWHAPLIDGEDSNLYDVLRSGESPNPDKELLHESLRTEIERALETLTPREADVVRLYFGLAGAHSMTLEEIGETFDLTRERVRKIKEKAIRRLKHTSRSKILKTYLG